MVQADMGSLFTCEDWGRAFTKNLGFSYVKGSQLPIIIFRGASNLIFQYLITISEKNASSFHWLRKYQDYFFFVRFVKVKWAKFDPFITKKSSHPDYTQRTKKQNTYLEVHYLFTVLDHYADKYNTAEIRHHWEINSFEDYMSKKKPLPNTAKQMDPDQRGGKAECSKYWRLIPTYKEAIWA